jgi:NADPH:quinone reductase-like Zn-dependent oxidoreductase
MKAFVCDKYGPPDVLQLREVDRPAAKEAEILVQVLATSLNAYDWHLLRADPFLVRLMGGGLFKPRHAIPGADIAGRVEAVGPGCAQFQPGDEVFGDIGSGGLAEYACAKESLLVKKPANLSFEQAAAVPMAALTALQGLRDAGQIRPGQKVLINGASGGVGTFAVQLAKHFRAEVTAVCSTANVEMARSLGADHVIDYREEDFTRSGKQYDLILAVNGYHPLSAYQRALAPEGVYVMAGGTNAQIFEAMLLAPLMPRKGGRKMRGVAAKISQRDLSVLKEILEAGKIVPVIDRCFPFREAIDALRYVDAGHARGKVVVSGERSG